MRRQNNLAMQRGLSGRRFLTERQFLNFAVHFEEDKMTNREMIYSKFEGFEEQLAHCYFLLHERFIADPKLAKFWVETAMDELQHSSILRFCRERGFMADADISFKTAENVEQLLDTVKSIAADPDVSVDEAFYVSLLMESSELEEVYKKLTSTLEKNHPLLFNSIRASLRSHHDALAEAAAEFSRDRGLPEAFRNLGRSLS
jgi:hypothetical protein